jgi:excinuclease ABC subunit A
MAKRSAPSPSGSFIRLRGVRQNNLKNFDLDLPLGKLIVITGLSGSGKSSLAFETLYAEGQRRYIETFSPYARQFFDRMDKPQVDSIQGIPPAIAIEQRNAVKTTRSTVGTMTELADYMKVVWPHVARLHCRKCHRPVQKDSPRDIWREITSLSFPSGQRETLPEINPARTLASADLEPFSESYHPLPNPSEWLVTFDLPLSEKIALTESLALLSRQGYQRLLLDDQIVRVDESLPLLMKAPPQFLTVLQDRIRLSKESRARFIEACEHAYHFGKGKLSLWQLKTERAATRLNSGAHPVYERARSFSKHLHCAACDLEYREPSAALFSFNHPLGACPSCRGFGRTIGIDYNLVIPDRSLSLAQGAVKPWQTGNGTESQEDLLKFCQMRNAPVDVPFHSLPKKWRQWVLEGDADYGKDPAHEWPHAWYGVKGYFRWLESKAYKMHVRVLLSRYRTYQPCGECHGRRFQPDALLYKLALDSNPAENNSITLADFYQLPVNRALALVTRLAGRLASHPSDPLGLALHEVRARLHYLQETGLGYLTLDRPTRSLSGGETERVNLTTCLGSRLVNTLFVLDEPSVGLHPRDIARLVRILQRLRDIGNTVVVVEHESTVIQAADHIIDLGPGHGESGGEIVFQGTCPEIHKSKKSLTGLYLSRRKQIPIPPRRPVFSQDSRRAPDCPMLTLSQAGLHNIKNLTARIPLGRFVCVTGVSGSGKTTLIRDLLLPALLAALQPRRISRPQTKSKIQADSDSDAAPEECGTDVLPATALSSLTGHEQIGCAILVDQSPLGRTPRSNPAVYVGAFEYIRELYAQADLAKQRGLSSSCFSFNSPQGQCERCRGAGFEKIEMQFLSDIYARCPDCQGRRYRSHILEISIPGKIARLEKSWNIADLLEATIDEVFEFLQSHPHCRPAVRALASLKLLRDVGLGYLRLGQPVNTLSGGECQRLKLVRHLAEFEQRDSAGQKPALFLFDEPTTGLHFDDVRVLLQVFQRLVNAGHSLLIIEHHLDVIKCADWVLDLGPDAGDQGGRLVVAGTPEQVAACKQSHTGKALLDSGALPRKSNI